MAFFLLFSAPANAQEITAEPICFIVRNEAQYKVYGSFVTDYYTDENGVRARHTSNFRLEPAGERHPEKGYPLDRAEFCSYGPFFPGRQLELVIRTLAPIFSCKTSIELGEIVIKGEEKAEGGKRTWAVCY